MTKRVISTILKQQQATLRGIWQTFVDNTSSPLNGIWQTFADDPISTNLNVWQTFSDGVSSNTGATVVDLANGAKHEFRVAAVSANGQGAWSNIAGPYQFSPNTGTTVTGLSNGINYEFRVAAVNAFDQGDWSNIAGPFFWPGSSGSSITGATVTGLRNGIKYEFKVAPVNAVGQGPWSNVVTHTPIINTVIWQTFSDGVSATTGSIVNNLLNGTKYEFRVAAVNSVGQSAWSNIINVTPFLNTATSFLLGSTYGQDGVGGNIYDWDAELRNYSTNASGKGLGLFRLYSADTTPPTTYVGTPIGTAWNYKSTLAITYSTKMTPQSIIAGTHNTALTSLFNSIPAGRKFYLTNYHEPYDNSILSGQFTPAEFRQSISHMVGLLNASNANKDFVKVGIILTGVDYTPRDPYVWYPTAVEGNKADFVGVDVYDLYRPLSAPIPRGNYRTAATILSPSMDFALAYGKPWLGGELSVHPDPNWLTGTAVGSPEGVPSRPVRVKALFDYTANHAVEVLGFTMYESGVGDKGPWWWSALHNYGVSTDRSTKDPATIATIVQALQTSGIA